MTGKKATRKVEQYAHRGRQRANNPPVGLVTPHTDPDVGQRKTWAYDPHIDPALHWAGKAERASFEVPTVSLHVHERIDALIEAYRGVESLPFTPGKHRRVAVKIIDNRGVESLRVLEIE